MEKVMFHNNAGQPWHSPSGQNVLEIAVSHSVPERALCQLTVCLEC